MDTAVFFSRILPRDGLKILAELVPFKDKKTGAVREGWRYKTFDTFAEMADAVEQFDQQGRTVYHACNAFGDWYEDPSSGKKRIRTQVNVVSCRSLYDDIDIGKEGCYADRKEAMAAVRDFVKVTGLPSPLVVYSGNGIHLYWALDRDISPDEWFSLAVMKRSLTSHFGLKVDSAVDLDKSRVLRPVGSTNRKGGKELPVEAKNDPKPITPEYLRGKMQAFLDANEVAPAKVTQRQKFDNPFGFATTEYPNSYADIVAEHCNVIKWFKEAGAPDEPVWHKCVGAIKRCADGEEKIHEWGKKYSGYDATETSTKIALWTYAPTTCEAMRSVTKLCGGCEAKCKSPIQLGYKEETKAPDTENIKQAETEPTLSEAEFKKIVWPEPFSVRNGKMYKAVTDPETHTTDYICFCDTVFYPTGLARGEDGEWNINIEYIARHGELREFQIAASDVASTDKLAGSLAAHTVWLHGKNGKAMATELVRKGALELQYHRYEVEMMDAFGWNADFSEFIIGNKAISAKGEKKVNMTELVHSATMAKDYGAEGTKEDWVNLVDEIYNRPGAEAYQFAFLIAAASPLVSMANLPGFHGLPIAYTGEGGRGKTRMCQVACSIWGNGDYFLHSANKAGSTINALTARIGIAKHLPWIMDEMTNQKIDEVADMLYALSNGKAKDRLNSAGAFASGGRTWSMFAFITGNLNVTELLATLDRQMAEAVSVRCFEVRIPDDYIERVFKGVNAKELIDAKLQYNYGVVGRELIRFYIEKRTSIVRNIHSMRQKYVPNTADETRERFYIDMIVLALVAGHIMKKLGLIKFDLDAIKAWAFDNVKALRRARTERNYGPEEMVSQYLSSLHGHTIITKTVRDLRNEGAEIPVEMLRGAPSARVVLDLKKMFVTAKGINDWCKENNYLPSVLRDAMDKMGYIVHVTGRDKNGGFNYRIAAGTNITAGVSRCFELDYAKVFGHHADATKKSNVTPFPVANPVTELAEQMGGDAVGT